MKNERQIELKTLKICSIVNIIALLLSDSNSSILFMVAYLSILVFYKIFSSQYSKNIRVILRKTVVLLLTVAIITACFFGARFLLRKSFLFLTSVTSIGDTIPGVPEETPTYEHENTNLDSGRLVLLKQSLSYIKKFPLFGIGKGNIIDMGYKFFENGLKFPDFHNGYLTIIVCSGFIGFILFMIFAAFIGTSTISTLMSKNSNHGDDIFPCLASFIGAYCVYALFEKTMMFDITFMVIIFWYMLGFCANYLDFYKMKFFKKLSI
ncbi:MAG: O-antigen ligase family protein [Acutalibacteraceae bacterium]